MALISFDAALALAAAGIAPLRPETVTLLDAAGRILAAPLSARLTQPATAVSAMDGYAVRAADIAGSLQSGTPLTLIGEAAAGRPFGKPLQALEAVRIFTGASLPDGADGVLIQEHAIVDGPGIRPDPAAAITLNHMRHAGGDFIAGAIGLNPGRTLDASALMLAAAMGHGCLRVARQPVVAILATGDELIAPEAAQIADPLPPGRIVASNSIGIAVMARAAGAIVLDLGIAADTAPALGAKLDLAAGADILVTIGGASVGDYDLVHAALTARGATFAFKGVAMRPGKPTMLGHLGSQHVVCAPGNPASAFLSARLFLVPLILRLQGASADGLATHKACLAQALPANGPRQHCQRAKLGPASAGGLPTVDTEARQDSSLITVLAGSDCFVLQPPHAPALPAGAIVDVLPFAHAQALR